MDVIFTHGAGVEVHQKTVMACRVTPESTGQQADGSMERKACGTMTADLLALSAWVAAVGITPVAMASTGEDWKPLYHMLAGEGTVCLVHAAPVQPVPGRQTDTAAARWLAQLMRHGLLQARCMPAREPRAWRDLTRDRTRLVQERRREVNRLHGVLERAHIQLAAVATDLMGVSARAILAALSEGRADPATMAELANRRRRRKMPLWEQALTGLVRDHPRQVLALPWAHRDFLDAPSDALRAAMTRRLAARSDAEPSMRRPRPTGEAGSAATPAAAGAPLTLAQAVTLLDTMPGGNHRGRELLVAEWGVDMARVGTAARLAAWSGVAPGTDESAGTQRSGKIRTGTHILRTGLTP